MDGYMSRASTSSVLGQVMCKANHAPANSGDEYRVFVRKIEHLLAAVKRTKQNIDSSGEEAAKAFKEAIESIRKYRKEIDEYLDAREHELLEKCYEINIQNEKALQMLGEEFKAMKYELDTVQSRLKSLGKQSGDMVLVANKTSSHLKGIADALKADNGETKLQLCVFKKSKTIRDMISHKKGIGKLETVLTDQPYQLDRKNMYDLVSTGKCEINVKTRTDKKDCYITSFLVLSANKIACADWANNSVKLVDTKTCQVTSQIQFTSQPWDLASISTDQLAVSITSENKIQFLNNIEDRQLIKSHTIDVAGRCRGVAYSKDKLVVSYDDPSKVEVINMSGKVLKCLKTEKFGNPLFERPYYVVLSGDGDSMYVSDNERNSVTRLTFDGQVLGTYKDTELRCPRGLVVCRDGSLLVCSSHGHSVHLISSECSRMKIMLRRKEGAEFCQAICYYDGADMLYLSNFTSSDQIRVYKFA